jgi:hypothetical protein
MMQRILSTLVSSMALSYAAFGDEKTTTHDTDTMKITLKVGESL